MNPKLVNASMPETHPTNLSSLHGKSPLSWKSAYIAFIATVFATVAAAATVASHDMPLLIGGF